MVINPVQFVVVPKLWAITLTMPVLSFLSSAIGIFGAFLVSLLYLDISPGLFWNQLCAGMRFRDFGAGFLKSVVFSWLIIWVGAYFGFRVRGGAEEVGRETTASVVAAIFVIVLADAFFSFVLP
jgi:phospholipid/cholesterol/gamma-HCH transport system permease protein